MDMMSHEMLMLLQVEWHEKVEYDLHFRINFSHSISS